MTNLNIEAEDILVQARKLDGFPAIAKQEFSRAMVEVIGLSKADQQAKAPVGRGTLRGSIHGEIRFAMGEEVRAVMTAEARAPDGFPYGYALDASKKFKHRTRRARTYRWFRGVTSRRRRDIQARFAPVPERIVKRLTVNGTGGGSGD